MSEMRETNCLLRKLIEQLALPRGAGALPRRSAAPGRSLKDRYNTDRINSAGRINCGAAGSVILNCQVRGPVTIFGMIASGNTNGWLLGELTTAALPIIAVTDIGPEVIFSAGINVNQSQFILPIPPQGIPIPGDAQLRVASSAGGQVAFTFILDRYIPLGV